MDKPICPLTMKECPGPSNCFPATGLLRADLPPEEAVCPIVCACDCLAGIALLSDIVLSKTGADTSQAQVKVPNQSSTSEERVEFIEKIIQPDQRVD